MPCYFLRALLLIRLFFVLAIISYIFNHPVSPLLGGGRVKDRSALCTISLALGITPKAGCMYSNPCNISASCAHIQRWFWIKKHQDYATVTQELKAKNSDIHDIEYSPKLSALK
jgi:hypothetical protein